MSRNISAQLRAIMYAPETGDGLIPLVQLNRQGWSTTVRLARNGVDVVHQGDTYESFPFDLTLPDDIDEGQPTMRFVADNVSRHILDEFRSSVRTIFANVKWVRLLDLQNVELELEGELIPDVYDVERLTGNITVEPVLEDPLVELEFTPQKYPGLFG